MAAKLELTLHPRLTSNQRKAFLSDHDHVLLTGVAGTGKTYTGLARGLKAFNNGEVDRIIIIRSAVSVRDIGHLPGDDGEKADPYTAPYVELVRDMCPKSNYRALESKKIIEFHLTTFLRGLTFDNAYVLVDEYQNMSGHELETVVTRVGQGTQLVICGDSDQSDLRGAEAREHNRVISTLRSMPDDFHVVEFSPEDVVRSEFVKRYFQAKREFKNPEESVAWLHKDGQK